MNRAAKPVIWTAAAALCMLARGAMPLVAQTAQSGAGKHASTSKAPAHAKSSAARHPSTLDGVYTAKQAKRGKDVYFGSCRSCHMGLAAQTSETFAQWWKDKQLSELYTFVLTRMPKNDPGDMDPGDVADVVAYLLQLNHMPVGPNEIYPDADSLAKYRIELKPSGGSTPTRKKP